MSAPARENHYLIKALHFTVFLNQAGSYRSCNACGLPRLKFICEKELNKLNVYSARRSVCEEGKSEGGTLVHNCLTTASRRAPREALVPPAIKSGG